MFPSHIRELVPTENLRRRFNRFCYQNRDKGIPNLMLWILIAQVVFYVVALADPSNLLYSFLCFNRAAIFHGQVWRIFTFILVGLQWENPIFLALLVICYYLIGRTLEGAWGTFRFNLYYGTGIVFLLAAGFIFNISLDVSSLHLSLFLAYATLFPETQFMIFFIIPVKARWLGIIDLVFSLITILNFRSFPYNLVELFILANYFLHFGKDFVNIFPDSWRLRIERLFRKKPASYTRASKTIPFRPAAERKETAGKAYRHRCTVCGRTDVTNPGLEFRYCSRCSGYHCYCMDHISNHTHITE